MLHYNNSSTVIKVRYRGLSRKSQGFVTRIQRHWQASREEPTIYFTFRADLNLHAIWLPSSSEVIYTCNTIFDFSPLFRKITVA